MVMAMGAVAAGRVVLAEALIIRGSENNDISSDCINKSECLLNRSRRDICRSSICICKYIIIMSHVI